jgi:hypothetical protein
LKSAALNSFQVIRKRDRGFDFTNQKQLTFRLIEKEKIWSAKLERPGFAQNQSSDEPKQRLTQLMFGATFSVSMDIESSEFAKPGVT